MRENTRIEFEKWYAENFDRLDEFTVHVHSIIADLVDASNIPVLRVEKRTKQLASALGKIDKKQYHAPESQITDISGIRIITYIESDIQKVCDIIEKTFECDKSKSSNKSHSLGVDKFGYRSVHYICELSVDRTALAGAQHFKGLVFEVQVRTILQHAWAEIEHDRGYKLSGVLPTLLRRRLNSLAGMLEIADREFANLASEIDLYEAEVSKRSIDGDLLIELNSTSLSMFLPEKLKMLQEKEVDVLEGLNVSNSVINELWNFGIDTLSALNLILTDHFLDAFVNQRRNSITAFSGVLRDAMLFSDIEKYFSLAWDGSWRIFEPETVNLLIEKYSLVKVSDILDANNIDWRTSLG